MLLQQMYELTKINKQMKCDNVRLLVVYTNEKNNLIRLLDMIQTLLHDQNVGSELDEARWEMIVAEDVFYAAHNGLSKSQGRKTQHERSHLRHRVNDCMRDLKRRDHRLLHEESEPHQYEVAADQGVRQEKQAESKLHQYEVAADDQEVPKKQESEPHQYEVAAADQEAPKRQNGEAPKDKNFHTAVGEGEFYIKDRESGEAVVRNEKDLPQFSGKLSKVKELESVVTADENHGKNLSESSKKLSEGEYNKKVKELESVETDAENHEKDLSQFSEKFSECEFYIKDSESGEAADKNKKDLPQSSEKLSEVEFYNQDTESVETADENHEKDLSKFSEKLSEGEHYKKVKELESVEAADENQEEDLSQSNKELSEDEFDKKAITQTEMEAAGSKNPDDEPPEADSLVGKVEENLAADGEPPEVNSLVGEEEVLNKLVGGEIFDPGPLEETGGVTGHSTGNLLSPSKPRFRMVGEEYENLAENGKPPEVNNLMDKENKNLVGDGNPSEVGSLVDKEDENLAADGKPTKASKKRTSLTNMRSLMLTLLIKKKLIKGSEAEKYDQALKVL